MERDKIPQMMRRDEFAEFMKVNARTVDTWIGRGKFSEGSRVKFRGRNYFKVESCLEDLGMTLDQWLEIRDSQ